MFRKHPETPTMGCKTVYPGSIPGVASTVFSMGWVGISVPSAKW
jgi:hypothetical protein